MKDEYRLELLKNKKSSIEIVINNTIAFLIALLAIATSILVGVMLQFQDFLGRTVILVFYLIVLYIGGAFRSISIIKSSTKLMGEIDKAIYDICKKTTKEKEIDRLIDRLY